MRWKMTTQDMFLNFQLQLLNLQDEYLVDIKGHQLASRQLDQSVQHLASHLLGFKPQNLTTPSYHFCWYTLPVALAFAQGTWKEFLQ